MERKYLQVAMEGSLHVYRRLLCFELHLQIWIERKSKEVYLLFVLMNQGVQQNKTVPE